MAGLDLDRAVAVRANPHPHPNPNPNPTPTPTLNPNPTPTPTLPLPLPLTLTLTRSDGSTLGLFGPGDARESWAEPDATPRSVVGPRFPLDITADEKLVLVAHFG